MKGFVGSLIMILVTIAIIVIIFLIWEKSASKSLQNVNGLNLGNRLIPENSQNKEAAPSIQGQLNDLRTDLKSIQDKKDKEIMDELDR